MTGTVHDHGHPHKAHAAAHHARVVVKRRMLRFGRVSWRVLHRKWIWRIFLGSVAALCIGVVAVLGLWWRLASGPIEVDMATPWLKAAMQDNFGSQYTVDVGG